MDDLKGRISRRTALAGLGAAGLAACNGGAAPAVEAQDQAALQGWRDGASLPSARQEIYPCLHEGAIHLAGGFIAAGQRITGPTAEHVMWKPDMAAWQALTPLPTARHHPQLISFEGALLAIAGFESPSEEAVWVMQAGGWRLNGEIWEPFAALPVPCGEAVLAVPAGGALHLAGGRSPQGEANASWQDHVDQTHHFVYAGGKWETAAPCLTARNSAAGDVIGGNWHIVGGRSVSGGNTAAHEVYDFAEDRWREAAPMPQAQGGLAAATVGGKLYAFGGEYFDNGGGVYPESWVYDPATDAWESMPDMPKPRHGLGAVALDGEIYVIGGALRAGGNETSAAVEIFTP